VRIEFCTGAALVASNSAAQMKKPTTERPSTFLVRSAYNATVFARLTHGVSHFDEGASEQLGEAILCVVVELLEREFHFLVSLHTLQGVRISPCPKSGSVKRPSNQGTGQGNTLRSTFAPG
jgi:hypothetical protein